MVTIPNLLRPSAYLHFGDYLLRVQLSCRLPGKTEATHVIEADLPAVPQVGDYLRLTVPGGRVPQAFLAKRVHWNLSAPNPLDSDSTAYTATSIGIDCEHALSVPVIAVCG